MPDDSRPQIQDFIFQRELAEVYLLLDNISAVQSKQMPDVAKDDPVFADAGGKGWVQQICEIGWPPQGTLIERAAQAAKLIRARDILNQAAAPATGASIAFTLLVAGEDRADPSGLATLWRRLLGHPPEEDDDRDPPFAPNDDRAPSRRSLARTAYPGLHARARSFHRQLTAMVLLLIAWLVGTLLLSWNVQTGQALLGQLHDADAVRLAALAPATGAAPAPVDRGTGRGGSQTGAATPPAPPAPRIECPVGLAIPVPTADTRAAGLPCDARIESEARYAIAARNLQAWMASLPLVHPPGAATSSRVQQPGTAPDTRVDDQWAAVLLGVLANAVLPICYGVLGAGAAMVRTLSDKVSATTLLPRDLIRSLTKLALGATIGGCIGLFIDPKTATTADPGGLLTATNLSLSALCFIAGFGVDGVFIALDALLRRIFAMPTPPKT